MNFWTTVDNAEFWADIDDLQDPKSKGYEERLCDFLASTPTPLRKLLASRSEALESTRPPTGLDALVEAIAYAFMIPSRRQARDQEKIAQWEGRVATLDRLLQPMYRDVQNIGLLLDTFDLARRNDSRAQSSWLQTTTYKAIVGLLRYVTPTHPPQFNAATRDTLYSFLQDKKKVAVIDALIAIAAVGDNRIVETVTRLATRDPINTREEHIQKAAQKCLTKLTARLEDEKLAKRLLRPSEHPESAVVLLRPAKGTDDSDPELLLRSISEDR
jgi:hypothetical protein